MTGVPPSTAPPGGYVSSAPPARTSASLSGLTEDEARSFHRAFITSFVIFTLIAIIAHWLVWQWRPWIPGAAGYPVAAQMAPANTPVVPR